LKVDDDDDDDEDDDGDDSNIPLIAVTTSLQVVITQKTRNFSALTDSILACSYVSSSV